MDQWKSSKLFNFIIKKEMNDNKEGALQNSIVSGQMIIKKADRAEELTVYLSQVFKVHRGTKLE